MSQTITRERTPSTLWIGVLVLLIVASALLVYKASGSLKALAKADASGTLGAKPEWIASGELDSWQRPLVMTANYFSWVFIALGFGVVIGAMVRAYLPAAWLARTVGARGSRGQLFAAMVGAPLMLCSCCIVPVFEGVYQRTRRLGPALAMMLASPALNPAALALTFMLFPAHIAWARLIGSLLLVLLAAAMVGRWVEKRRSGEACSLPTAGPDAGFGAAFVVALRDVAWRSLPAIVLGVILSAMLTQLVPITWPAEQSGLGLFMVVLVAALAVPLAMPTFGEIPIALALMAAGAPDGAVLAILIAGPSINLPSLLGVGRAVSARAAVMVGLAVFVISAGGGLLLGW